MKLKLMCLAACAVVALGIALVIATGGDAGAPRTRGQQDRTAQAEVGTLAGRGDEVGRQTLVQRYAEWASRGDKLAAREQIIDALLASPDRRKGLKAALKAIALDPRPIADDPMVDYAAAHMAPLWKDPMLFQYGRDLLVVQTADKARVTMVASLVPYVATLTEALDPEDQIRSWMANDLVDVYYQSGDEAKPYIVAGVKQLGADDVAATLGGSPRPADLAVVQERADQIEQTMRDLHDPLVQQGADPSMINPDREQILNTMSHP